MLFYNLSNTFFQQNRLFSAAYTNNSLKIKLLLFIKLQIIIYFKLYITSAKTKKPVQINEQVFKFV